jgi:prolyl-tRNA synthetase
MILPVSVAPWTVHICPIRIDNDNVKELSFEIYNQLNKLGIDKTNLQNSQEKCIFAT